MMATACLRFCTVCMVLGVMMWPLKCKAKKRVEGACGHHKAYNHIAKQAINKAYKPSHTLQWRVSMCCKDATQRHSAKQTLAINEASMCEEC